MTSGHDTDPDFDLATVKRRASPGGRERIDVDRARRMYDKLGTWRAVAEFVRRKNGQAFTPLAIFQAVRWADQGNAGRRI